jgi:F0F1-type ATP synthase membrane subunit b/b'
MMRFARLLRFGWRRCLLCLLVQTSMVLPVLAQEEAAPSPADSLTGFVFRWLNFALVFGTIIWAIRKFGRPYFAGAARFIQESIGGAAAGRAAVERELNEVSRQLASLDAEVQDLRRAALSESASEAERLRALTKSDAEKVARAAVAEMEAAERAARQQLRTLAARVATDRAAALVRQRMNDAAESSLFGAFLGELERGAQ